MAPLLRFPAPALIVTVLAATPVWAGEPAPVVEETGPSMDLSMHRYFGREKEGGKGFIGSGVVAVTLGGSFFLSSSDFVHGVAYPFVGLGVVEIVVGTIVYLRTDAQVRRLEAQLQDSPTAYKDAELRRMQRVNRGFRLLKIIEISLAVAGTGTAIWAWQAGHDTVSGVGAGIAVHSALLFGLDHMAEERASLYTEALQDFDPAAPRPIGLALGGSFD